MLINFFKQSYLQQFLALFAIQLLLWGKYLIAPHGIDLHSRIHPIYDIIMDLNGENPWTATIIAFCLLALAAILINIIMIRNELVPNNSLIPALIFIVIMSQGPVLLTLYPELIAIVFLLLAFDRLMRCYGESDIFVINNILSASIFTSLAAFSYLPALWFVLLIWISMFIFRQLSLRIWTISVIGISLPLMYLAAYNYIFDKPKEIYAELLEYFINIKTISIDYPDPTYVIWGLIIIILIISVFYALTHLNEWNVNIRRKIIVILWLMIITIPVSIYSQEDFLVNQTFLFIPVTMFISSFLGTLKIKKWQELVFLLFVILIVCNNHLY